MWVSSAVSEKDTGHSVLVVASAKYATHASMLGTEPAPRELAMIKQVVFALVAGTLVATAADTVVSSIVATQRMGTNLVDVSYALGDVDSPSVNVSLLVSTNAGATFDVACTSIVGDVGAGVSTGANKQIVWNVGTDLPGIATSQMCVRIFSDDDGVTLIPAGLLITGNDTNLFPELYSAELPLHSVSVNAFYMDRYEVTYTLWTNVRTWATSHGYSDLAAGSGNATNHPVQTVTWYDCVKWSNARSEMQGLMPCYYTSTNFIATNIYRAGAVNLSNNWVNWSANGYRLPTEAEWEKAARGGTPGHRFPWSNADTIRHARANYYSDASYAYDTSPTRGYHPTWPSTSPVGYFAPNGYGLYDMAGNVWEWCWDWYDGAWYGKAGATQSDTRGPASGSDRVLRGGSRSDYAAGLRCTYRTYYYPSGSISGFGFRCVRRL